MLFRSYVEPASETEKAIAAIWQTILGVEKIGLKDNFFDLGGHSLKATRVISKIKKDLGYEIPLKVIFETPTIEGLCNAIPSKSGSDEIEVLEKRQSYELSHAQERLWFLDKLMPESGAYNIPVPFIIDGPLDIDVMKNVFKHKL